MSLLLTHFSILRRICLASDEQPSPQLYVGRDSEMRNIMAQVQQPDSKTGGPNGFEPNPERNRHASTRIIDHNSQK